jgi:hypothetical protein
MYRKPFRSRICRNVDLDEVSAVQPDNHEALKPMVGTRTNPLQRDKDEDET